MISYRARFNDYCIIGFSNLADHMLCFAPTLAIFRCFCGTYRYTADYMAWALLHVSRLCTHSNFAAAAAAVCVCVCVCVLILQNDHPPIVPYR